MTETVTYVTQSKYFSTAFNAAIFDGPIRIYFAQYQESQALKLYFNLQERFGDVRRAARGIFKERGRNIFVMLYPTGETFDLSFGETLQSDVRKTSFSSGAGAVAGPLGARMIVSDRLGADVVVGVRGPLEDDALETLCNEMDLIVQSDIGLDL